MYEKWRKLRKYSTTNLVFWRWGWDRAQIILFYGELMKYFSILYFIFFLFLIFFLILKKKIKKWNQNFKSCFIELLMIDRLIAWSKPVLSENEEKIDETAAKMVRLLKNGPSFFTISTQVPNLYKNLITNK